MSWEGGERPTSDLALLRVELTTGPNTPPTPTVVGHIFLDRVGFHAYIQA